MLKVDSGRLECPFPNHGLMTSVASSALAAHSISYAREWNSHLHPCAEWYGSPWHFNSSENPFTSMLHFLQLYFTNRRNEHDPPDNWWTSLQWYFPKQSKVSLYCFRVPTSVHKGTIVVSFCSLDVARTNTCTSWHLGNNDAMFPHTTTLHRLNFGETIVMQWRKIYFEVPGAFSDEPSPHAHHTT